MVRRVHVIGAGLAGLAAALRLQADGARVTLHEAAAQAGGRCRSYHDRVLDRTIDNGNHLVLSGNTATLGFLDAVGARDRLAGPSSAEFPFVDLASGERWTIRLGQGRLPTWIFSAGRRVPGTRARDYLPLARLLRARPGQTLGDLLKCEGLLWSRLVHPLFLAVLNTDPREGSAALAGRVMRETLAQGGRACRPLVAHTGLGHAFVEPALAHLERHGAEVKFLSRLRAFGFDGPGAVSSSTGSGSGDVGSSSARPGSTGSGGAASGSADNAVTELVFDDARIALGPEDGVVLAVPPASAQALLPGLPVPTAYRAIVNLHFGIVPPAGCAPITGMLNSTAEWLFAFHDRLSVTISGADRLLDRPREDLVRTVWAEVAAVTGLPVEPLPPAQLIRERRATFAATPEEEDRRPQAATRWRNLVLAGDWTATGLPATIEGAIRSGNHAAQLLTATAAQSQVSR